MEIPNPKEDCGKPISMNGFVNTNGYVKENGVSSVAAVQPEPSDGETVEIQIPVPWGYIAAKAHGSPNGRPVLAVHGWMDNAGTFERLIPLLPKSLYIVAVDLPGHGLSSHVPLGVPYHFADFIISLRRIVKYFEWTKFIWLGHSMGAGLGSLYASSFPSQVECLIMLDLVKPITGESGNDYATKIAVAVDHFLSLEEKIQPIPPVHTYDDAFDRLMKGAGGTLTEDAAKALFTRGATKVGEDQWCFNRDLRLRSPSILRFSEDQCSTILSQLGCATLIIKAVDGPWFEAKEVCERALEIYKKNCSVFRFVEVEGNHYVHLNEPPRCSGQITEFLAEIGFTQ